MEPAHFVLSRSVVKKQLEILKELGLHVSYSYKTNHEVGNVIQEFADDTTFSIHTKEEINMINEKSKIIFFLQAESDEEINYLLEQGIKSFVIDNETDLENLLNTAKKTNKTINLSIRMKFSEHRIGTGKYFVYGLPSRKVNEIIQSLTNESIINELGIHIHRKSQNTSEWEILSELQDSINEASFERLNVINLGGGLPAVYKSYSGNALEYIFKKLQDTVNFLKTKQIKTIIEPGRFICAPSVKLVTKILQIQENNIVLNTTIYNCALDTHLTGTKMLVAEELNDNEDGNYYLLKGNSPTRDDIFRYKVKLNNPKIGDKITFLNAGAYNYTTDFFGYKKLETNIIE